LFINQESTWNAIYRYVRFVRGYIPQAKIAEVILMQKGRGYKAKIFQVLGAKEAKWSLEGVPHITYGVLFSP
jgi:hypothetical protein